MNQSPPKKAIIITPAFKAGLCREPAIIPLLAAYRAAASVPVEDEAYDAGEVIAAGRALCDHARLIVLENGVRAQGATVVRITDGSDTDRHPSTFEQLGVATNILFDIDDTSAAGLASAIESLFTTSNPN